MPCAFTALSVTICSVLFDGSVAVVEQPAAMSAANAQAALSLSFSKGVVMLNASYLFLSQPVKQVGNRIAMPFTSRLCNLRCGGVFSAAARHQQAQAYFLGAVESS
jgi:hypothetical protein